VENFDIVICGSGFGGSIMSMVARSLGYRVLLLDKGEHPRFAIGESSTPFANLLIEKISTEFGLPGLFPFSSYGTWRKHYPGIACGLKRGFSFFNHQQDRPFEPTTATQLLVAASPNDQVADTHWYRPDFDACLVRQALDLGIDFSDRTTVETFAVSNNNAVLKIKRDGVGRTINAGLFLDASGPRGFLWNHFRFPEIPAEHLPPTLGLFNHFVGVPSWEAASGWNDPNAPYPVDDSAVHHLFDGGWIWVLRFNNGITSAGVSMRRDSAEQFGINPRGLGGGWAPLLGRFPTLKKQFDGTTVIEQWRAAERLYFRSSQIVGVRWAMLPGTAGFVDPLLSTGFAMNLYGILRLGRLLKEKSPHDDLASDLETYRIQTSQDLDAVEQLIGALYLNFGNFHFFQKLVMLYFTAVSFGESAWRLGKEKAASRFLLQNNFEFNKLFRRVCEESSRKPDLKQQQRLIEQLAVELAPYDVAGLTRSNRSNCFPADMRDLLDNGFKLGASPDEVRTFLDSMDFSVRESTTPNTAITQTVP